MTEPMTLREYKRLTPEKKVAYIINSVDETRMDNHGGYPTDWTIENGKVYWANLDGGKDYNKTLLEISPIEKFIKDYDWIEDHFEPPPKRQKPRNYRSIAT